ncbi:hypothetical protein IPN35_06200 [Candidatus Peregrinibacteria bacterium]|nr:MAG: hypothetical protein IPN35_06200 [Candidatus Peregrinibacteria bacterium]
MLMIEIPTPKSGVLSCCASCGHTQNAKGVPVVPSPTKTEEKPPQLRITATDIPPEVQALLDMERAKIDARFDGYEKDEQKIFGLLRDVPGANFLSNLLSRFF